MGEGNSSSMASKLEYHDAPPHLIRHGLPLGHYFASTIHARRSTRRNLFDRKSTSHFVLLVLRNLISSITVHVKSSRTDRTTPRNILSSTLRLLLQNLHRLRPLPTPLSRRSNNHLQLLLLPTPLPTQDPSETIDQLRNSILRLFVDDGIGSQLHVCRGD